MSRTWTIISIYYKNLQNNCSKIHLYKKVIFGQKDMQSFFNITHLISFAPYILNVTCCFLSLIFLKIINKFLFKEIKRPFEMDIIWGNNNIIF